MCDQTLIIIPICSLLCSCLVYCWPKQELLFLAQCRSSSGQGQGWKAEVQKTPRSGECNIPECSSTADKGERKKWALINCIMLFCVCHEIAFKEFLQMWHKSSLWVKDALISSRSCHRGNMKHFFGYNSWILTLMVTKFHRNVYCISLTGRAQPGPGVSYSWQEVERRWKIVM